MESLVITGVEQLDVDWFNRVLGASGALVTGSISDFDAEPFASINGRLVKIGLRYMPGSTGRLPTRLLLKMCEGRGVFGPSEVDYYVRDYAGLPDVPIPTCYDAQYSLEQGRYHLLLDDLSATHRNNWESVPTGGYGCAVAEALATLHAHWWNEDRRRAAGISLPGEPAIARYIAQIEPGLEPMLKDLAGSIGASWAPTLHDLFEHHPRKMVERAHDPHGFTLIHGDVNPGNILSPLEDHARTYLIDRQPFDWSLTTWLGVSDVAYLMVHWWPTELRRELEFVVLRHYHESLMRHGIASYAWDRLVLDYRLCAVQSVYVATAWCTDEEALQAMKWVWLPQLQRSLVAFFDLRCSDLWR